MRSREDHMVVLKRDDAGLPTIWCDPEIVDLVSALNTETVQTVASCSGHGHRPGFIALKDGRVLLVCASLDEARKADHLWPDINEVRTPNPPQPSASVGERAKYTEQMVRDASGKAYEYMGDSEVVPLGLALELVRALTTAAGGGG